MRHLEDEADDLVVRIGPVPALAQPPPVDLGTLPERSRCSRSLSSRSIGNSSPVLLPCNTDVALRLRDVLESGRLQRAKSSTCHCPSTPINSNEGTPEVPSCLNESWGMPERLSERLLVAGVAAPAVRPDREALGGTGWARPAGLWRALAAPDQGPVGLEFHPLPFALASPLTFRGGAEGLVGNLWAGFEGLAAVRAESSSQRGLHAKSVWRPPLTVAKGAKRLPYEGIFNERRRSARGPMPRSSGQRWRARVLAEVRSS